MASHRSALVEGARHPYLVIVTKHLRDRPVSSLREWLRNERRLGVPHWPLYQPTADEGLGTANRERSRPRLTFAAVSMLPDDPDLPPLCTEELTKGGAQQALDRLNADHVRGCTGCVLHKSRTQTVFGAGSASPDIVFVGEGPGVDEDREGIPFVGRAGQLLTRMIAAMTLTRDEVYICNVIKCRPPGNRTPAEPEMRACVPFLDRQLAILRPKVIVALGRPAAQTLLDTKTPIGKLRGQFHDFPPPGYPHAAAVQCKLMPTFHPAYLLRAPWEKGKAWEDLKQVMRYLSIPIPAPR
jgi:uracil-DNA glycosylase family 4